MEFDERTDRLPFNDLEEAEQARAAPVEPSHDPRIRHLQRVPLFSGSTRTSFVGSPGSRGSAKFRWAPSSRR
jgi:hypothetical protein